MTFEQLLAETPKLREYVQHMPQRLRSRFTLRRYAPHSIIHSKDSVLTAVGIVCRGEHRVINEFENGNIFMVEKNEAVSFIGEVTLLAGHNTTSVTIETLTECLVMYFSVEDFEAWLREDIHFLRLVSQSIAYKLYHTTYSRGERQFYSAGYLLFKYLAGEAQAQGVEQRGRVVLKKTRQRMGEELGMTVKTLNRTIARLRDEGFIELEKGKIALSREQLAAGRARSDWKERRAKSE